MPLCGSMKERSLGCSLSPEPYDNGYSQKLGQRQR